MQNIKLVFEFKSTKTAADFMATLPHNPNMIPVGPVPGLVVEPTKPALTAVPDRVEVPTIASIAPPVGVTDLPVAMPIVPALPVTPVVKPAMVNITRDAAPIAPVAPVIMPSLDGTIKPNQANMRAATKAYKEANGQEAYKAMLTYFGCASMRDVTKAHYADIIQMCTANVIPTTAPPAHVAPLVPATAPAPVPEVAVSPEDLRRGLSDHKARWGLEATKALLERVGYPDPNTITQDKYSEILQALVSDDPTIIDEIPGGIPTAGIDLSMF